MQGWIKLHRKSVENPLFKKPLIWHLWNYLLLSANHKEAKIIWNKKEMVIERGSLIFGRKSASLETGLSQQNIRTGMETLVNLGMVQKSTTKSTTKFSYVSICNYDVYQVSDEVANHQTNQQPTSNQPATNQQLTTNNNVNNNKNDENVNNSNSPTSNEVDRAETEKPIKFGQSSDEIYLCRVLIVKLKMNGVGTFPTKNLIAEDKKTRACQKWAATFDLMMRLDNRPREEIERAISYVSRSDNKFVVLSPDSLRKKYENIKLAMNGTFQHSNQKGGYQKPEDPIKQMIRDEEAKMQQRGMKIVNPTLEIDQWQNDIPF